MSRRPPSLLVYAQLGMTGAFYVLAGWGLGWLVDSLAHTLPAFMLVGLLAGVVLAARMTWREVKKYL